MTSQEIDALNQQFKDAKPQEILAFFLDQYHDKIALASSLGAEDQVITHMLSSLNTKARIFTLDTGRVFPETYDTIMKTTVRYKMNIEIFFPRHEAVQEMVNEKGINLFYESVENRKMCCDIRKMEPLRRAFSTLDAWICGLRKSQSITRKDVQLIEWDETNKLLKINPLINWSEKEVWDYIKTHQVPYNLLHDKGYPSIGCQPCTRAIQEGEDVRAGRWWWENPNTKECGLHKK